MVSGAHPTKKRCPRSPPHQTGGNEGKTVWAKLYSRLKANSRTDSWTSGSGQTGDSDLSGGRGRRACSRDRDAPHDRCVPQNPAAVRGVSQVLPVLADTKADVSDRTSLAL